MAVPARLAGAGQIRHFALQADVVWISTRRETGMFHFHPPFNDFLSQAKIRIFALFDASSLATARGISSKMPSANLSANLAGVNHDRRKLFDHALLKSSTA